MVHTFENDSDFTKNGFSYVEPNFGTSCPGPWSPRRGASATGLGLCPRSAWCSEAGEEQSH